MVTKLAKATNGNRPMQRPNIVKAYGCLVHKYVTKIRGRDDVTKLMLTFNYVYFTGPVFQSAEKFIL